MTSRTILRAFAVSTAILSGSAVAAAEFDLRFAEFGSSRGPRAEALQWWADEVAKRSDGRIEVEFFWGQSLAKGPDALNAIGSGLADAGTVVGTYAPAQLPVWNLANMPFSVDDMWVGMRVWDAMQEQDPDLQAEMKAQNVKLLANYSSGNVHLHSIESPILSLDDLKGKKVRTTSAFSKLLEDLGAVPVALNIPETYQAMERGTVDATINYIPYIKAYKHYEVGDYLTEVGFGQTMGYGLGINLDLYNEMPDDLKEMLEEVSNEFLDVYGEKYVTQEQAAKDDMIAGIDGHKVEFLQLDPEERARWMAPASEFLENWKEQVKAKGVDPEPILSRFESLKADYQNELAEKGYPWTR
ncbi:MAG: C4-dicarboxylate TRAP transporter substrate-binding protein [Sagittula sp.]|uniref:C4-dicarboxylate TRAP transporter substrate-binding protein n=1 Tax=Sagittula sp. TaxID=2038081 RepID=UPI004058F48F